MVILFSTRKNKHEKEIIEILKKYGASHISDKQICEKNSDFTVISIYKTTDISVNKGIAVFLSNNHRFNTQKLPIGIVGISEEDNFPAFKIFKSNNISVITCGIGNKNTITLSSIDKSSVLVTLQRSIINTNGSVIIPCELKIALSKAYSPLSIMISSIILILKGILPTKF